MIDVNDVFARADHRKCTGNPTGGFKENQNKALETQMKFN